MGEGPLNINLNLLTALEALLRERSVTLAAGRLGLSQPAVSASLARLRRHFDDALLVRVGNAYELTPLGEQLREDATATLARVSEVFAMHHVFDAGSTDRSFSILMSDYSLTVLGEALSALVSARAPHARLELRQHAPADIESSGETLRGVDGIILPRGFLADPPHTDLFIDTWTGLVDAHNPMGTAPTLEQLAESPWVTTFRPPRAFTPPMRQLETLGVVPRVEVVVESFLAVPPFIVGTRRIAIVQARLAGLLERAYPVRTITLPFPVEPLTETFWWHPLRRHDAAHIWLRQVLVDAAAMTGVSPSVTG